MGIGLVYMNEIIVLGGSFSHKLKILKLVFDSLRSANLKKMNLNKCNMYRGRVPISRCDSVDSEKRSSGFEWPG